MRGFEEIQIHRRSGRVDSLDDDEVDEFPLHHKQGGCIVWPRTSVEEGKGEVVIAGENVFTPPGADVLSSDRVMLRGVMYEVEGKPGDYRKGPRKKGLLVVLKTLGS